MSKNNHSSELPKDGDRVLWIRFWAFGDVLQSAAEAMLFKERFPGTHLTFLTKPLYADLIREQPWCEDVISGDKKPFSSALDTLRKIKSGKFEWIISTNHGGRTAVISLLSGVRNRIGTTPIQFIYTEKLEDFFKRAGINNKDRSRRSIFAGKSDISNARIKLSHLPEKKMTAIIGASCEIRMWPLEHWVKFLSPLLENGWGVVLVGSGEREITFSRKLEDALCDKNVENTVGKLSITELLSVIAICSAAAGNDTGTLHLAALSGIPTVGFSDYDKYEWLGLTMPWFIGLSAVKNSTHRTSSTSGRSAELLAEVTPEMASEAFGSLIL